MLVYLSGGTPPKGSEGLAGSTGGRVLRKLQRWPSSGVLEPALAFHWEQGLFQYLLGILHVMTSVATIMLADGSCHCMTRHLALCCGAQRWEHRREQGEDQLGPGKLRTHTMMRLVHARQAASLHYGLSGQKVLWYLYTCQLPYAWYHDMQISLPVCFKHSAFYIMSQPS